MNLGCAACALRLELMKACADLMSSRNLTLPLSHNGSDDVHVAVTPPPLGRSALKPVRLTFSSGVRVYVLPDVGFAAAQFPSSITKAQGFASWLDALAGSPTFVDCGRFHMRLQPLVY